jgi:signal transduction histidine kinase
MTAWSKYRSRRAQRSFLAQAFAVNALPVFASVLCVLGFMLVNLFIQRETFRREGQVRAESIAQFVAQQSELAVLLDDKAEMERIVQSALEVPDVLDVAIQPAGAAGGMDVRGSRRLPNEASAEPGNTTVAEVGILPSGKQSVMDWHAQPGAHRLGTVRVGLSTAQQMRTFRWSALWTLAIALAAFAGIFVIQRSCVKEMLAPLASLMEFTRHISQGDLSLRAEVVRDDEVGRLAAAFNEMVDALSTSRQRLLQAIGEAQDAQQRLMDMSREAGMAEVATGVLHNVGNVLNSINVSGSIVASKIRESRIANVVTLAGMLQEHAGELPDFLTHDPQGQRVVPYLTKLGSHLEEERQVMLRELELLTGHVGHVKAIVATQQDYAKVSGLVEVVSLPDLIEDAIRIVEPGLDRYGIHLERDHEAGPPVAVDKHSLLQILLNLLRNAKQAVTDSDRPEKSIRVRIRRWGEDRIRITVEDNGVGLPPENLTRIFSHGFTTRHDGHGFGLHSGANAARRMGGALWAESDGLGRGATFILELPMSAREAVEETQPV